MNEEATPQVIVKRCMDCPFRHYDDVVYHDECSYPGLDMRSIVTDDEFPEWCPLIQITVTRLR